MSSDTEFTADSSPPIIVSLSGSGVEVVDRTSLDSVTDSEDDDSPSRRIETDHESGTDGDATFHRYTVTITEGEESIDFDRSWESDGGVTSDGKNVSMDERSWGGEN